MSLSYAYVSVTIISLVLIVGALVIALKHKSEKIGQALSLVLMFILIGSFCKMMELGSTSFEAKHLWRNLSQVGLFLLPASSYNFIMVYSNEQRALFNRFRIINFVFAFTCVLLIFTNDVHGIMRVSVDMVDTGLGFSLKVTQTLFGKICVTLNTLMNVIAMIKLWIYMRTTSSTTKMQVRMILIGFIIPIAFTYTKSAIAKASGVEIPIPFYFMIGIIFILWGVYRYDFMAISPIARDWVIDEVNVGMVFTNPDNQVVDTNRYAREMIKNKYESIEHMISLHNEWSKALSKGEDAAIEITTIADINKRNEDVQTFSIQVHDLCKKNKSIGAVSLITDISEQKAYRVFLEHRAERDSMTQVYNRETFSSHIERVVSELSANTLCGLMIFDIDKFKLINDTYGHQNGDDVIKKIIEIIRLSCRESDLIGRLGGDEFMIFIEQTDKGGTDHLIRRIQKGIDSSEFLCGTSQIKPTISIGVTLRSMENIGFKQMYKEADEALYKAKEEGRNRACYYQDM